MPVAVYATPERQIRVWLRDTGAGVVTLSLRDGVLVDPASSTRWDPITGRGISGPLADLQLAPVAWATSYDWAWLDFHPHAQIVR